jgi:hypothetical protein
VGKHRDTIYERLRTDPLLAAAGDAARFQARHPATPRFNTNL